MIFSRFGVSFWHHFGLQNRSRGPSGANRSTLDFERQYNENQAFSPWSVPGDTQNHSQKPSQKIILFSKDLQPKKYTKIASKLNQNCNNKCIKTSIKNHTKNNTKIASKWKPKWSLRGGPGTPKITPGDPWEASRAPWGGPGVPSGPPGGDLGCPRNAPETKMIPKSAENNEN